MQKREPASVSGRLLDVRDRKMHAGIALEHADSHPNKRCLMALVL
ncbi:MAG: hypothetical protein KatS3mg077_3384 [Candidatus Binatia bacterium]|nr:MAG: hypothetical protein KatS3mg077_3384 [Candidatus Binatia bacterium]